MRWEYRRLNFDIREVSELGFEDQLNALGEEGWELVATLEHARHGYSHEVHLVFKRPMPLSETAPPSLRVAR
jgi:hypothetical protein